MINLKNSTEIKIYVLTWIPFFICFGLVLYYGMKKIPYPMYSEIKLPEEYKTFINYQEVMENPINLTQVKLKRNPFLYESISTVEDITAKDKKSSITLTSIFIFDKDKRSCLLNNKLYKEGSLINDIKILKIGDYYVDFLLPNKKRVRLEVGATFNY